jgi:hypothetical protein
MPRGVLRNPKSLPVFLRPNSTAWHPELRIWCDRRSLPLHVFAWRQEYGNAGFAEDATYLIRPDTYVALAADSSAINLLQRYFDNREIRIEPPDGTQRRSAITARILHE